jgi:DNA-binding beta-propeller fold protein YncE
LLAGLIALLASRAEPGAAAAEPFHLGPWRFTIGDLRDPRAVAIGPGRSILVAERDGGVVSVFDATGSRLREIGGGVLLAPAGVAATGSGAAAELFVTDAGLHRVFVFGASGTMLRSWGGLGTAPGELNEPRGVEVRGDRVYVADLGNHRVQVFDRTGASIATMGRFGAGEGELNRPADVTVDEDGTVYVTDSDNSRVHAFAAGGALLRSWGEWGPFAGFLDEPAGVVLEGGRVLVADARNHRIQVFAPGGAPLARWGFHAVIPHEGEGRLHYPADIAIARGADGEAPFAAICEPFERRVQVFAPADTAGADPPPPQSAGSQSHFGERIHASGPLLTIAEPELHRIHLFETSGAIPIIIGDFGERGPRAGQLLRIAALDLDASSRTLLVGDGATRRLQIFDLAYDPAEPRGYKPDRARLFQAVDLAHAQGAGGTASAALRWPIEPAAVRRGPGGDLYVLDARNAAIVVLDPSFAVKRTWGGFGTEPGRFRGPTDLALSPAGDRVYVADALNERVQVFEADGSFREIWSGRGADGASLRRPFGVAAGADGFVYVTDSARHEVFKLGTSGLAAARWGRFGTAHGELWSPRGIAVDGRGRIIVVDHGNHRAQIFSSGGDWLVTFGTGRAYTKEP